MKKLTRKNFISVLNAMSKDESRKQDFEKYMNIFQSKLPNEFFKRLSQHEQIERLADWEANDIYNVWKPLFDDMWKVLKKTGKI